MRSDKQNVQLAKMNVSWLWLLLRILHNMNNNTSCFLKALEPNNQPTNHSKSGRPHCLVQTAKDGGPVKTMIPNMIETVMFDIHGSILLALLWAKRLSSIPYQIFSDSSMAFSSIPVKWFSCSSCPWASSEFGVMGDSDPIISPNRRVSFSRSCCWWYWMNLRRARVFSCSGRSSKVPWTLFLALGEAEKA